MSGEKLKIIDLVAPGSPVTLQQIRFAIKQVKSLGFKARLPSKKDIAFILNSHPYYKLSPNRKKMKDEVFYRNKYQHLKKALMAQDSVAVWCIRGGYGSQKLMPWLLKMKKPARFKPFVGYSDVTVLHIFFNTKWNWPSVHFPVLLDVKEGYSADLTRFQKWLCNYYYGKDYGKGLASQSVFSGLKLLNTSIKRNIKSYLTGGNLTLIQSSIGTVWEGCFVNVVLFLEDIGESAYRIDRSLWQMENAGVFKGVKALVLGDFIDPKTKSLSIKKVFQNFADRVSFPVLSGVPCGHGKRKSALFFKTPCRLNICKDKMATLSIAKI